MSDASAPRPRVLLIACYELGHQPLSLAWPLALMRPAGFDATALDLAAQPFDEDLARSARLVAIAAPMHTALRLGVAAAERVRALNPSAHVCFWGLYAALNADTLLSTVADSVVRGEDEAVLVGLAKALAISADPASVPGLAVRGGRAEPMLARPALPVPDRRGLPSLTHYARYVQDGTSRLTGYVEASRGCLHTCRHCPIVPVYAGRFFAIPAATVVSDIRQQVAAGAEHMTFGDPDFLNGPGHALRVARALHSEFPELTFDFTTKVEHILQHRGLFAELADLGATLVTSAIESLSPLVLARLAKGHTPADIDTALEILDAAGLPLRPTLVAFTPWTSLDDYLALLDFIQTRGLQDHIPPVQLTVRLLIPPGSPLREAPDAANWLRELDPAAFGYRWTHPDPRMDRLYIQVAERLALAAERGEPEADTYAAVRTLALAVAGGDASPSTTGAGHLTGAVEFAGGTPGLRPRPAPPRLTEDWFC